MVKKFTVKLFLLSRVHEIINEVCHFRQENFETYPEVQDRFKNAFRKYPNLNIRKLAQIYLFHNKLRSELRITIDVSTGRLILTIEVNDANNLFERIAENQGNQPKNKKAPSKVVGMHNVDIVTALVAQVGAIMKKLDTLTQSMHIVQHPAPICTSRGIDHINASWPLAFTHMGQPVEVNYVQNYQKKNGPYPHSYYPGLNKHPNYVWVDNSNK